MERLLVAYDGSDQAGEAAVMAARLAGRLGAAATLVTVGRLVTPIGTAVVPTVDPDAFRPVADAGAEIMRRLGVDPTVRVELGAPVDVIRELATREAHDAIILGHHGRGRIEEVVLGSVAKAVAATAPCPVLVVPSAAPERIDKILVAVSDPAHAERATDVAVRIARAVGAAITLLHVIDAHSLSSARHSQVMVRRAAQLSAAGLGSLGAVAARCERSGVACDALQPTGRPADVIQAVAADHGYSLIVMGRRDRGVLERMVLGSVSDEVLRRATRPVLVVR